jgi:hypothetical protein
VTPPPMVGRITDDTELPGGAVLLMKRAREAGGWFTWATGGSYYGAKTEKGRVLVKGRHADGRRFVVNYVEGKVSSAYVRRVARHGFARVGVADVRAFIDADGVSSEPLTGRE